MTEPNFVNVTPRELYDSLQSLSQQVGGMRSDMSAILGENTELRKRVRSLELKYYSILAGLIATVVGAAIAGRVI